MILGYTYMNNPNHVVKLNLHLKRILLISIAVFILCLIIFIVCSYLLYKYLKVNIINTANIYCQYNKKCQTILDEYGDFKINKMYLVREPFSKIVDFGLNILTCYTYKNFVSKSHENVPYHTSIIFEIILPNKKRKMLLIEKKTVFIFVKHF